MKEDLGDEARKGGRPSARVWNEMRQVLRRLNGRPADARGEGWDRPAVRLVRLTSDVLPLWPADVPAVLNDDGTTALPAIPSAFRDDSLPDPPPPPGPCTGLDGSQQPQPRPTPADPVSEPPDEDEDSETLEEEGGPPEDVTTDEDEADADDEEPDAVEFDDTADDPWPGSAGFNAVTQAFNAQLGRYADSEEYLTVWSADGQVYDENDLVAVFWQADGARWLIFPRDRVRLGLTVVDPNFTPYAPLTGSAAAGNWAYAVKWVNAPFTRVPGKQTVVTDDKTGQADAVVVNVNPGNDNWIDPGTLVWCFSLSAGANAENPAGDHLTAGRWYTWYSAPVAPVRVTAAVLTDGAYFAAVRTRWDDSTHTFTDTGGAVWLHVEGPDLVGPPAWVPTVGDLYDALPQNVRNADGLPVYTVVDPGKTSFKCPQVPGLAAANIPTATVAPTWVLGYDASGCLVKVAVANC